MKFLAILNSPADGAILRNYFLPNIDFSLKAWLSPCDKVSREVANLTESKNLHMHITFIGYGILNETSFHKYSSSIM